MLPRNRWIWCGVLGLDALAVTALFVHVGHQWSWWREAREVDATIVDVAEEREDDQDVIVSYEGLRAKITLGASFNEGDHVTVLVNPSRHEDVRRQHDQIADVGLEVAGIAALVVVPVGTFVLVERKRRRVRLGQGPSWLSDTDNDHDIVAVGYVACLLLLFVAFAAMLLYEASIGLWRG